MDWVVRVQVPALQFWFLFSTICPKYFRVHQTSHPISTEDDSRPINNRTPVVLFSCPLHVIMTLCQPRVIVKMIAEKQMECRLAGDTEVLGENLPQNHFCPSQNPTWSDPGLNPDRRGGKPATIFLLLLFGLWGYWHCGHSWPIVPASGDSEDDCGEADGM
jgi:hypothetical protein